MYVQIAGESFKQHTDGDLSEAWLIGAKAGLEMCVFHPSSSSWMQFYSDVHFMTEWLNSIDYEAEQSLLEAPCRGSYYDYLGGLISVTGVADVDGLRFRLERAYHEIIQNLLPSLQILDDGEVKIPWSEVSALIRLVPIYGPLMYELEEDYYK